MKPRTLSGVRPDFCYSSPRSFKYSQSGLTLVEILIGLSITAILAGLTVGSFSIFSNFATSTEINNLIADLYYSRSEALKRRVTVTLCRSENGASCNKGSGWEDGWIIFSDRNRNRQIDGDDVKLVIREGLDSNGKLTLGSGYYYYIMFSPTGEAYPRNTFKYCRQDYPPKAVILFATGRARISSRDSSGKPLEC